jgi:pimeloyl-ACP methyl ester carboxylesterase
MAIVNDNSILYKSAAGHAILSAAYDEALRRWPVPCESPYVDTRHGKTHVLVAGREDAPPLFFFHGWNGSACGVDDELDLAIITQHFRLYAPDTIGQSGRSAPNRPSGKGDAYGEWILDLFAALNIQRAFVSGISGGGYLTLKIAAFAPERVIKAFAISSAGLISLTRPGLGFMLAAIPAFIYPGPATGRLFVRMVSGRNIPFSPAHERMAQGMALLFHYYRMLGPPGFLSDHELRRISAPVYVLMGEKDSTVSASRTVERAKRLIHNVQTEIVPDAGHTLTMDRRDIVMKRMMEFLGVS